MRSAARARQPRAMTEHASHTRAHQAAGAQLRAGWSPASAAASAATSTSTRPSTGSGSSCSPLLGGAGILIYLAAVLVIPDEGEDESIAAEVLANRRDHPGARRPRARRGRPVRPALPRRLWPAAGAGWALVLIAGAPDPLAGGRRGHGILIAVAVLASSALCVAAVVAVVSAFAWFDVSLGDGVGEPQLLPARPPTCSPTTSSASATSRSTSQNCRRGAHPARARASVGIGRALDHRPARDAAFAVDAQRQAGR